MNTEILVIEDDDLVRQGIVDILELKGWNAVAAKSCSEALVRIRGEEYMLYVLDMKLPDGNGIMLCREIRRYTDNPILFLSAYDSEEFIVEGFEAGANDYVIKPFRTFEFIARIKALLRRTGMQNGKKVKKGIKSGEYELDLQKQILQIPEAFQNCIPGGRFHCFAAFSGSFSGRLHMFQEFRVQRKILMKYAGTEDQQKGQCR